MFSPAASLAQSVDGEGVSSSSVDMGDEIIVTAQRRSAGVNSVPMSIAAFSGNDLSEKGVRNASDLIKIVPGFSASDSGGNAPVYTLRGVGLNESSLSANPAVAIYTDEVPLPYAAMTRGAMLDLARVEVLKGPQGTLYGTNSTGGAVNYIPNEPGSSFGAGGSLSFERFSLLTADGYV